MNTDNLLLLHIVLVKTSAPVTRRYNTYIIDGRKLCITNSGDDNLLFQKLVCLYDACK